MDFEPWRWMVRGPLALPVHAGLRCVPCVRPWQRGPTLPAPPPPCCSFCPPGVSKGPFALVLATALVPKQVLKCPVQLALHLGAEEAPGRIWELTACGLSWTCRCAPFDLFGVSSKPEFVASI